MSRSDYITQSAKKIEYFSDFKNNFGKHPITNQLVRVVNADSVAQAIKNLILTDKGEIPFRPELGSNVRKTLFENFGPFSVEDARRSILDTIKVGEPRAQILDINIYEAEAQNSIGISIIFSIINSTQPYTLDLTLKRVR